MKASKAVKQCRKLMREPLQGHKDASRVVKNVNIDFSSKLTKSGLPTNVVINTQKVIKIG